MEILNILFYLAMLFNTYQAAKYPDSVLIYVALNAGLMLGLL